MGKFIEKILFFLVLGIICNVNIASAEEYYQKKEQENNVYKIIESSKEEFKNDAIGLNSILTFEKKTDTKYELGVSLGNDMYKFIKGFNSIEECFMEIEGKYNYKKDEIPIIVNEHGKIIFASQAMGRVIKFKDGNPVVVNGEEKGFVANIYEDYSLKKQFTYVNTGYIDDVPIISNNGNSYEVLISGYRGWMDGNTQNGDLAIVPLNQVKNPSYYFVKNGDLYHYISSDINTINKGFNLIVGEAPSFMVNKEKYYSYDGKYFYTDLQSMIEDLKNKNVKNAINKSAYYNYLLNLPLRSKTLINEFEIDKFLNYKTSTTSKLRNSGNEFSLYQDKYGVNALIMLGIAANESSWGTSNIAKNNNNLFGLGAYDSDPTNSAHKFSSISECIENFAKGWMSKGYLNPSDWRFKGAVLGNKAYGINVSYASDPFWGEKAASKAYEIDKYNGKKDNNNYQLAIYNKKSNIINQAGEKLYGINEIGVGNTAKIFTPVIIANTKTNYINNNYYYKINPERNVINNNLFYGDYDWSQKYYVDINSVEFINIKSGLTDMSLNGWSKNNKWYYYEEGKLVKGFKFIGGNWYLFNQNGEMSTGWQYVSGNWYYMNTSGEMLTGWQYISGNWYYMNASGEMTIGWQYIAGKWYYMNTSGEMLVGWQYIAGKWYCMDINGEMSIGWTYISGHWYYMNASGEMLTGWQRIDGYWYYMKVTGEMLKGWQHIDGYWYYMNDSGVMLKGWQRIDGYWYYMNDSGVMLKGWQRIDGYWYYMNDSGVMLKGWQRIDGYWYYMNDSGVMLTGWQHIDGYWYYMNDSGVMLTGWQYISGEYYFFNTHGVLEK